MGAQFDLTQRAGYATAWASGTKSTGGARPVAPAAVNLASRTTPTMRKVVAFFRLVRRSADRSGLLRFKKRFTKAWFTIATGAMVCYRRR
jgi:hypothetical protein